MCSVQPTTTHQKAPLILPSLHSHYCAEWTVWGKALRRTGSPVVRSSCDFVASFSVCLEVPWCVWLMLLFVLCVYCCDFEYSLLFGIFFLPFKLQNLFFSLFFFLFGVGVCVWEYLWLRPFSLRTLPQKPRLTLDYSSRSRIFSSVFLTTFFPYL